MHNHSHNYTQIIAQLFYCDDMSLNCIYIDGTCTNLGYNKINMTTGVTHVQTKTTSTTIVRVPYIVLSFKLDTIRAFQLRRKRLPRNHILPMHIIGKLCIDLRVSLLP